MANAKVELDIAEAVVVGPHLDITLPVLAAADHDADLGTLHGVSQSLNIVESGLPGEHDGNGGMEAVQGVAQAAAQQDQLSAFGLQLVDAALDAGLVLQTGGPNLMPAKLSL